MEKFQIITGTVIQGPQLKLSKGTIQASVDFSTSTGYRSLIFNLEKPDDITKLKALFSYVGPQCTSFEGKEIRLVMYKDEIIGFAHHEEDKFICTINASWYEFTEDGFEKYAYAVLSQNF